MRGPNGVVGGLGQAQVVVARRPGKRTAQASPVAVEVVNGIFITSTRARLAGDEQRPGCEAVFGRRDAGGSDRGTRTEVFGLGAEFERSEVVDIDVAVAVQVAAEAVSIERRAEAAGQVAEILARDGAVGIGIALDTGIFLELGKLDDHLGPAVGLGLRGFGGGDPGGDSGGFALSQAIGGARNQRQTEFDVARRIDAQPLEPKGSKQLTKGNAVTRTVQAVRRHRLRGDANAIYAED